MFLHFFPSSATLDCKQRGNMVQRVSTVAFEGIEARSVDVQVQVAPGLPAFAIAGRQWQIKPWLSPWCWPLTPPPRKHLELYFSWNARVEALGVPQYLAASCWRANGEVVAGGSWS